MIHHVRMAGTWLFDGEDRHLNQHRRVNRNDDGLAGQSDTDDDDGMDPAQSDYGDHDVGYTAVCGDAQPHHGDDGFQPRNKNFEYMSVLVLSNVSRPSSMMIPIPPVDVTTNLTHMSTHFIHR